MPEGVAMEATLTETAPVKKKKPPRAKADPSRVYAFGAKLQREDVATVNEVIYKAHRYRNKLVEIERDRRERSNALVLKLYPNLDLAALEAAAETAEAAVTEVEDQIKQRSVVERARTKATAEEKARLKELRAAAKAAKAAFREARKQAYGDPVVAAGVAEISAETLAKQKQARKESDLFWGTYCHVEAGCRDIGKGRPPKFRRWDERGALAVQIQKRGDYELSWSDALACKSDWFRLEILPVPTEQRFNKRGLPIPMPDPNSKLSQKHKRAIAWLRVGTDGSGKKSQPVWLKVPFILKREPRHDPKVKWVRLQQELIGRTRRWELQFVLSLKNEADWRHPGTATEGEVGIDVNWRSVKEGLRIAYAVGSDGQEFTLILPREWLKFWQKVDDLRSIRDQNFNIIRAELAAWIKDFRKKGSLPEWFEDRAAYLAQWKSSDRLSALVWLWRNQRFAGDDAIYAKCEAWRVQDRHLHEWQAHQSRKIVKRRNKLYRVWIAELRCLYKTVKLESTSWAKLAEVPLPDEPLEKAARVYSRIAAPGRFSELLREMFAASIDVAPEYSTKRCHHCGKINNVDFAKRIHHVCCGCKEVWDQDRNAAYNHLSYQPPPANG